MLELRALPAFEDNYIWAVVDGGGRALIVDPGDAAPVLAASRQGLAPVAILLTHHHADHAGGAAELMERWSIPCFAPPDDRIQAASERVDDGASITIKPLSLELDVIAVPGHTRSHIAFHGDDLLFCGDTLFSLGCGRMFEGHAAQMLASLDRLAALPPQTRVCCGHEYTLANAAFAQHVDPHNQALAARIGAARVQRARGAPTLPSRLGDEVDCNPFLRAGSSAVADALTRRRGTPPADRVDAFAALRQWKDGFRPT
jgi:hydroxyacylglutathione hydrolase